MDGMQFSIENNLLSEALKMSHLLTRGLTHTNCVFRTSDDSVVISAASSDCWIKTRVSASIKTPGEFCTKTEVLAGLKLKGKELNFTLERPKLLVKSGRTKIELATFDVKNVKTDPPKEIQLTHLFKIDAFRNLVDSMKYDSDVIENIDVKPINIRSDGEFLKISTNDAYTVGHAQIAHENLKNFEVCIPGDMLFKILPYLKKDFKCGISETAIRIRCDGFDLTQNYLQTEKKVIDVDAVLQMLSKKTPKATFSADRGDLLAGLDEVVSFFNKDTVGDSRVMLSTNKEKQKLKLFVDGDNGKINSLVKVTGASDASFMVSLYLVREFVYRTTEQVDIKYYGDKILIGDKSHTFIMPTVQEK